MTDKQKIVVKNYIGSQSDATAMFQSDSTKMAAQGYYPISQTWAPGSYGCGAFLLALLLCVILVGILIFVYMLIVKPPGTLSVTYERRGISSEFEKSAMAQEKTCPQCAERVKAAALVCRFCGHKFVGDEAPGECPNCEATIPMASISCPYCQAIFDSRDPSTDWKVKPLGQGSPLRD